MNDTTRPNRPSIWGLSPLKSNGNAQNTIWKSTMNEHFGFEVKRLVR